MTRQLLIAIAVTLLSVNTRGAQAPAWFGVPLPAGLGDPHRPILDVSTSTPAAAIVPAGEEGHRDLAGVVIRKDLEAIVGFAKADRARGERAWGRITGFKGADDTHAWVLQQFTKAGLRDVETQTYAGTQPVWYPKQWEVKLLAGNATGTGSRDVSLASAFPTSGSRLTSGPIRAPLVFVGATSAAALPDVDVKGKVAVQTLHPPAGAYSERTRTTERARELAKRGAVAVLNVIEQAGNMHVRDFSNCGVPCFNLGTDDGRFLTAVMQRSPDVRVSIALDAELREGLKGHNTIGAVRGRNDREMIIVNAHADGWFDAAGDNGDGLAVLVALARHFARPEHQPERTLLFVASGGHHGGGLNGPGNLVSMNPSLKGHAVMVLNLEHIAQLQFRNDPFRVEAAEQPMGFGISNEASAIADIARRGMQRYGFALRPAFSSSIAGDLGGYAPLGVPRVQAIHSGPMYHTSGDTLDTISTPGLERAARFYAFFINEAAKTGRAALDGMQQPAAPPAPPPGSPAIYKSVDELVAALKAAADRGGMTSGAIANTDQYRINLVRRVKPGAPLAHAGNTELHYITEGSGTLVTGGTIARDGGTAAIHNGETRRVTKGDVILVPADTPHWYQDVEGSIAYLEVRFVVPVKQ